MRINYILLANKISIYSSIYKKHIISIIFLCLFAFLFGCFIESLFYPPINEVDYGKYLTDEQVEDLIIKLEHILTNYK